MFPNLEHKFNYSPSSQIFLLLIFIINLMLVFSGSYIRTFIDDNLLIHLPYYIRMQKYVYETGLIKYIHPILGFSMLTCSAILWNHVINLSTPSKTVTLLVKFILYSICAQILIGEGLRFNIIHESFRLYHLWLSSVILGLVIVAFQRIRLKYD